MEAGAAAGIGISGMAGFYALIKCIKRALGFKSCKYHSKSDNDECIFGCRATKRVKDDKPIQNIEDIPEEEKLSL